MNLEHNIAELGYQFAIGMFFIASLIGLRSAAHPHKASHRWKGFVRELPDISQVPQALTLAAVTAAGLLIGMFLDVVSDFIDDTVSVVVSPLPSESQIRRDALGSV